MQIAYIVSFRVIKIESAVSDETLSKQTDEISGYHHACW